MPMKSARISFLACGAALCLIVGCATGARKPPQGQAAPEQVSIASFSRNPFQFATLPGSRMHRHEDAVSALGQPLSTDRRDAPSQHDPSIVNTVITLHYAFGDLVYLHVAGKDIENLILIRLHGNQAPLRYGIRFGETTREQIVKLFGAPEEVEENSVSYSVVYTQELTNSTTFYFKDKELLEVDISSLMMD